MHAEVDTSGNLSGRIHQSILSNVTAKFQTQVGDHHFFLLFGILLFITLLAICQLTKKGNSGVLDVEITGPDYTTNLKTISPDVSFFFSTSPLSSFPRLKQYQLLFVSGNPQPVQGTGVFVVDYLQNVTRNLTLGVEALVQKGPSGSLDSGMTFVGRYTGSDFVATGNLGLNGSIQASYFHKVNEQISIGSEIEVLANSQQRESVFTLGAKFDFRQALFRCQFDSHGRVSSVLEQRMAPGLSFVISGELDHAATQSRFGLGLLIGGQ